VRDEVLTLVKMSILVSWAVTPCGVLGRYQCFAVKYCLHLQRAEDEGSSNSYGVTLQEACLDIQTDRCMSSLTVEWVQTGL
jgi:hypothetical protein